MCAIYAYLNYRGETFRKEFSKLGDVRSLIPESVRVMALTATATRRAVIKQLKKIQPKIVSVLMNTHSLEETFAPLIEGIRQKRKSMDRTIIFCRTYDQCAHIYMFIVDRLGKEVTEPIGISPDLASFRIVDMFTACTHPIVKESILKSLPAESQHCDNCLWYGPQHKASYSLGSIK